MADTDPSGETASGAPPRSDLTEILHQCNILQQLVQKEREKRIRFMALFEECMKAWKASAQRVDESSAELEKVHGWVAQAAEDFNSMVQSINALRKSRRDIEGTWEEGDETQHKKDKEVHLMNRAEEVNAYMFFKEELVEGMSTDRSALMDNHKLTSEHNEDFKDKVIAFSKTAKSYCAKVDDFCDKFNNFMRALCTGNVNLGTLPSPDLQALAIDRAAMVEHLATMMPLLEASRPKLSALTLKAGVLMGQIKKCVDLVGKKAAEYKEKAEKAEDKVELQAPGHP